MAKKKKKTSQNSPTKTTPLNKTSRKTHAEQNNTNDAQCSAIALSLAPVSATKQISRSIHHENNRIVSMHESDASGFSVRQGEEVIVLQIDVPGDRGSISTRTNKGAWSPTSAQVLWKTDQDEKDDSDQSTMQPRFVSICRVDLSQNKNNFSTPKSSGRKAQMLREGEAQLSPIDLAQRIIHEDQETSAKENLDASSIAPDGANSPIPTTTTKPSPAKQQFTFESFVSPSSNPKTPPKQHAPQTKPSKISQNLALLPLRKNKELYQLLAADAKLLKLHFVDAVSSSFSQDVLEKAEQVLERIFHATCHGIYIAKGDIIVISFQGKKLRFKVQIATGKASSPSVNDITESLSELRIEDGIIKEGDGNDSNTMSGKILSQLRDAHVNPVLFQIIRQTQVQFVFKLDVEENPPEIIHPYSVKEDETAHNLSNNIVAGLDSISDEVKSMLIPALFHPERFPFSGPIRAPKGLLLHGTSGCGKSLLAEQVISDIGIYAKRMSISKRNVHIVRVNCSSIQSSTSVMGDAERKLTRTFELAEEKATLDNISTLLVMDDIHLICPRRGIAGEGIGVERVASTLLALMDGIGNRRDNEMPVKYGNVVILAITTNPSLLDSALRRSGRLDTELEIPSPDEKAKIEIFALCLRQIHQRNMRVHVPVLTKTELLSLSTYAKGFTGADIALSIKEAIRFAISRNANNTSDASQIELTYNDIQQAVKITKPSSIKSISVEVPTVPWSSIGGMDSVKRNLREAIELPLTHSNLFESLCITPPRGVLLYGPPGCSKTLMARALATDGNMNFLTVKGPELLSKWLGESERALAALFRRARLASPCVIFFDEIDAIASKRGSGGSSGGERMLSQLLTELDGVNTTKGNYSKQPRVIVVGATNRPDLLDPALMRPGRIDRKIYVGIPDFQTRKAIFLLQLKGKACDPNIDVSQYIFYNESH